ncbi:glutamic-type intramembrane protease PrsW [Longirhabdus pacifica]|uniref:glutamic-type intramembrane protease PrsW n=1 Tax=Longirhabdus pacifica TaxID=2305227 RepID=UPI001F0BF878|nr:glutamic-type intramembrane protease PrsW [Longirhabdus pacifica]
MIAGGCYKPSGFSALEHGLNNTVKSFFVWGLIQLTVISGIIAALAPGIALMLYFYLKHEYTSPPFQLILRLFVAGVLIVLPVVIIQRGLILWVGQGVAVNAFIVSALVEEFLKWFILYYLVYTHSSFDEPSDGIVYAVSVSLGFATLENILYAWSLDASITVMMLRALLPVSGHALFAVTMGYYLALSKFDVAGTKKYMYVGLSILSPVLWHGSFNYINMSQYNVWMHAIIIPFMLFLWALSLYRLQSLNKKSPYFVDVSI